MRLETSISEQDKRLLMLTGIAAVLAMSFRFLIYPAFSRGRELEREIAEVSAVCEERQARINELSFLDEAITRQRLELEEAVKPYYRPLKTTETGNLITELAVRHGLFPENLSLTEAKPGMVDSYIFAPEEEIPETAWEETSSCVLLASACLDASGEAAQWQAFLNDVVQNYPGLRVTRFEVPSYRDRTAGTDSTAVERIQCGLEIYMCGEETGT